MICKGHTLHTNRPCICFRLPRYESTESSLGVPYLTQRIALQDDPKLWYGIGILYDRYGSLDHAEEAFASVLRMNKGMVVLSPTNVHPC